MRANIFAVLSVVLLFAIVGAHAADDPNAIATADFANALATAAGFTADATLVTQVGNCFTNNRNIQSENGVRCSSNQVTVQIKYKQGGPVTLPAVPSGVSGSQLKISSLEIGCNNNNNDCQSAFPSTWVSISSLQKLKFDNFELSGTLPCDWTGMTALTQLTLDDGFLTGPLPEFGSSMRNLDMGENNFCGTLPASWASLPLNNFDLEVTDTSQLCGCASLWAGNKKLKGELSDLGFATSGDACHRTNKVCSGTCATCTVGGGGSGGKAPESATLRFLRLIGAAFRPLYNNWTGDDWQSWEGVTGTDTDVRINLSTTPLRGALPPLPDDLDGSAVAVTSIDISGSLTVVGTLPASWGTLTQLQSLTLSSTGISGTLPAKWTGMTSLTTLSLSNTLICGALPAWSIPTLTTVNLSYNFYLRGSLADSWGGMSSLTTVSFTNNTYCGTIPSSWSSNPVLSSKLPTTSITECTNDLNKCRTDK